MRNLKRALSLVMAAAMLIGMMVVSASAATTYEDFTDKDEIKNTEAVNTMVSLGVINGKEDGSCFDPTGIVTRAEMAKLIAVSLYGGRDLVLGTGAAATQFSDTKGHWAEAYIAYCANLGIINGKGDGTFGPNEPVTGTAAAKMFLCALGYKSDLEGLTGPGWDLNTDTLAMKTHLYDDLNITPSDGLNRDNTAQLVYNGVQADEVKYENLFGEYSDRVYAVEKGSMLVNRFGVTKVTGIAIANEVLALNNGGTTISGKSRLHFGVDKDGNQVYDTFLVSIPNEMLGQEVVLYVKYSNPLSPNAADSVVIGDPILTNKNTVVEPSAKLWGDDAAAKDQKVKDVLKGSTNSTAVNVAGGDSTSKLELTVTTANANQTVKVSVNGADAADYNPNSKPSVTGLGNHTIKVTVKEDGFADRVYDCTVTILGTAGSMSFTLTTPSAGGGNSIDSSASPAIAVAVVNNTTSVVLTGTKSADQTVTIGGDDAAKVTADNTSATNPTYTVDTTAKKNGGAVTFTLTLKETNKPDVVYTVTITVAYRLKLSWENKILILQGKNPPGQWPGGFPIRKKVVGALCQNSPGGYIQ